MLELISGIFSFILGLPGTLWQIITAVWSTVPFFWYFVCQGIIYWLLTLPRTTGTGVLSFFTIIGAFSYFITWSAWHFLRLDGIFHHEVLIISLLHIVLLGLPTYILVFHTPAGQGTNLMDGLALGAFTGLGYQLVRHLSAELTLGKILSWPPGSILTDIYTIVPEPGDHAYIFRTEYMAWGALIGFALVLAMRMRSRWRWWFAPIVVYLGLIFLEFIFGGFGTQNLLGGQNSFWYTFGEWFYRLDNSGRGSSTLFLLSLIAALVLGEMVLSRGLKAYPSVRLVGEPSKPGILSEIQLVLSTIRFGCSNMVEVWGFFLARRRLAVLEFERRGSRMEDTEELEYCVDLAADLAAERLYRAESALEGQPVIVSDEEKTPRWRTFFQGLVLILVGSLIYMGLIGWFGVLFTARLNKNPVGYVYAFILVSGMAYTANFYRKPIIEFLARGWSRLVKLIEKRSSQP